MTPIPEGTPGHAFLLSDLFGRALVFIPIETDEGERPIFQPADKRPLLRDQGHARAAPRCPEVQHDDLAPEIAQLHRLAVEVLADDVRRHFADAEVLDGEDPPPACWARLPEASLASG